MENLIKIELITEGAESFYRLSGPFTQSGVKNRNGRVYPYSESKREILKLKEQVESGKPIYLYKGHPPHGNLIKEDSAAVFEEITFIDDGREITGWCKVRTLTDTQPGREVNESLSKGNNWGISTRGTGNVVNGIVENYNMITADLVETPSCQICNMRITEAVEERINDLNDFLIESEICPCLYSTLTEDEKKVGQQYVLDSVKNWLKGL